MPSASAIQAKSWQHISVIPIAGSLGAEVGGVHLGQIDDAAFREIQAAFLEYQVLFFRDQEITRDQQKDSHADSVRCTFTPSSSRLRMKGTRNSSYSRAMRNIRMLLRRGTAT
jgi:hypothetical protein